MSQRTYLLRIQTLTMGSKRSKNYFLGFSLLFVLYLSWFDLFKVLFFLNHIDGHELFVVRTSLKELKEYNLCVIEPRAIFKELLSLAAFVSEFVWSRISESSPKFSHIFAAMISYKKMPIMKYFLRKVLTLKIYQ